MQLTNKESAALSKLPLEKILAIMHECAEIAGCVSVDDYCRATGEARRTVYDKIKSGKLLHFRNQPFVNQII